MGKKNEIQPPVGIDKLTPIKVRYTNHRGETRIREIIPIRFAYKNSTFHSGGPEYIMECWDVEKRAMRDYSLKDCDFVLGEKPLMTIAYDHDANGREIQGSAHAVEASKPFSPDNKRLKW